MGIMVEAPGFGEGGIECILPAMAERRMAKVVGQAQGLGQILIETQGAGDRPSDLGDFEAVGQPDPEMVAVGGDEHLGFVTQAAESDRMDDAVAVALKDIARSARAFVMLGVKAATRLCRLRRKRGG